MKYRIAKYEIDSDDTTNDAYKNAKTFAIVESPTPLSHSTYEAMITNDVGHGLQHINLADHEAYDGERWVDVECAWIDIENEVLYFIEPMPDSIPPTSVDEYYQFWIGANWYEHWGEISYSPMPINSVCGDSCKQAIDIAAAFMRHDNAIGGDHHHEIARACHSICSVYCNG